MYSRYDGKIDDADEPLEMNPGGLVCVCTNNLTKIELTLKPDGLPGKVTLSATEGGERIRIWQNPDRTDQIILPKAWNAGAQPGALYVEGIINSAAVRDVGLRLEYDENPPGQDNALFKCEDRVKLTVVKVGLEFQNSHMSAGKLIDPLSPPRDVRVGVVQGDTIKFKAKLTPTVSLQNGDYVWTGVQSGNGLKIDITFSSVGTHSEQLQVLRCQARIGLTTVMNVTELGQAAWMPKHPQYWISAPQLRDEALAWARPSRGRGLLWRRG